MVGANEVLNSQISLNFNLSKFTKQHEAMVLDNRYRLVTNKKTINKRADNS